MSESKDNTWIYIIVVLLIIAVSTLFSIEDELKAQRTPEQIAKLEEQSAIEKQEK